jgi:hypothetical protein
MARRVKFRGELPTQIASLTQPTTGTCRITVATCDASDPAPAAVNFEGDRGVYPRNRCVSGDV